MKNTTTINTTIGISAITETIRTIMTSIKNSLAHSLHSLNAWRFMWHSCAYAMAPVAAAAACRTQRMAKHRLLKPVVGVTGACCWHATDARAERASRIS